MSVRNIQLPKQNVQVTDGESFPVRGLSVRDISILVHEHGTALAAIWAEYGPRFKDGLPAHEMAAIGQVLAQQAPTLVSHILALATDEPDDESREAISRFPLPVLVDGIEKVMELTFRTEADLKNVVETVIRGLRSSTAAVNTLTKG